MNDFLFVIIELFSLALTVDTLKGKTCQNLLLSGGVGQFEPTFQGEVVVPGGSFSVHRKLDTFLLSFSEDCIILHSISLTHHWRVTDRQTDGQMDGIAITSTAPAMRALRRAVIELVNYCIIMIIILLSSPVIIQYIHFCAIIFYIHSQYLLCLPNSKPLLTLQSSLTNMTVLHMHRTASFSCKNSIDIKMHQAFSNRFLDAQNRILARQT